MPRLRSCVPCLCSLRKSNAKGWPLQRRKACLSFLRAALPGSVPLLHVRKIDNTPFFHALRRDHREDVRYVPQQGNA